MEANSKSVLLLFPKGDVDIRLYEARKDIIQAERADQTAARSTVFCTGVCPIKRL